MWGLEAILEPTSDIFRSVEPPILEPTSDIFRSVEPPILEPTSDIFRYGYSLLQERKYKGFTAEDMLW